MTSTDVGQQARPSATAARESDRLRWSDAAKAVLVVNPGSGGARSDAGDSVSGPLRARLEAVGCSLEIVQFGAKRWKKRLAAAMRKQDVSALFIAGGDGTVLAVVSLLARSSVPIGIIPRGTMNWVARDLGIPLEPSAAISALLEAPVRRIDAATANGRLFLCACMIGFGPLLARWRERERGTSPWLLWPKILWRGLGLLQRYRHLRIALVADGKAEQLKSRTVVVTNNLIGDSLGPMPLRPRLDGGVLGLYAVRKVSAGELTRLGTRLMLGSWQTDDAVLATAAPQATLAIARRRAVTLMLDGERTRVKTPLDFAILPAAVAVLAPGKR